MFSQPMIALLFITLYSCSKKNTETGSLVGNWNVVNDSTFNTNKIFALSAGESGLSSSNFIGEYCQATFNFYSNGNIVTSFYNCTYCYPSVDSAKYVLAGNQITISIFAQNSGCCSFTYFNPVITRKYTISNLTANNATLTFNSVYSSPSGGVSGMRIEIINLKK
jgi:hypothetical protein